MLIADVPMVVLAIMVIVAKYSSIHYDETGW